ncbi:glycosyltransferase family 4 protein, partial [Acidobacteriota bacterium]
QPFRSRIGRRNLSEGVNGFLKDRIGPEKAIVLFMGRKTRYKGADLILKAAPKVWEKQKDVVFVFAGPDTEYSKNLFSGIEDTRILMLPELTEKEKASALSECDIFCMPSSEESLGGVYIEAWSVGKPVIALDIPPVREMMDGEESGCLTREDPDDLADKLLRLIENPSLAAGMAQKGRQIVSERFDWDGIASRMEAFYQELTGRR